MLVLEVLELVYSTQLHENMNALIFKEIFTVACVFGIRCSLFQLYV